MADDRIQIQVFNSHGHPLTTRTKISLDPNATIEYLLERVEAAFPSFLRPLEPNELRVFRNEADMKKKGRPLQACDRMAVALQQENETET